MIPRSELQAVLDFPRGGSTIFPGPGFITLADQAQLVGAYRGFWDASSIGLNFSVVPSFDAQVDIGFAFSATLETEP